MATTTESVSVQGTSRTRDARTKRLAGPLSVPISVTAGSGERKGEGEGAAVRGVRPSAATNPEAA